MNPTPLSYHSKRKRGPQQDPDPDNPQKKLKEARARERQIDDHHASFGPPGKRKPPKPAPVKHHPKNEEYAPFEFAEE